MHQKLILDKIASTLAETDNSYDQKMVYMLDRASRVFVAGAGRSGLVCKNFAMRLVHTGYDAFIVGETSTRAIVSGDLLVIISGSGETQQLEAFALKAKQVGADIVLITSKLGSSIGKIASTVFQIGRPDNYGGTKGMPMGSVFELSTLIFLEATVSHIIHEKNLTEETMRSVHANME